MATKRDLRVRHVRMMLLLADRPQHGYVIAQQIEEQTGGRVSLRPGSLYRALHQLLARGLIAETDDPGGDPRRRAYALTPAGRAALGRELATMNALVEHGRRLGVLPGGG